VFIILIDDVFVLREHVAISGKCENKNDFNGRLVDDDGVVYKANIPFIKYVTPPAPDYITIELTNVQNPNSLYGRVLKSA